MPPSTSAPSCRTGNAPMAGPGSVVVIEVPAVGGRCPFAPPAPEAPMGGDLGWLCPHQPARSLSLSGPAGKGSMCSRCPSVARRREMRWSLPSVSGAVGLHGCLDVLLRGAAGRVLVTVDECLADLPMRNDHGLRQSRIRQVRDRRHRNPVPYPMQGVLDEGVAGGTPEGPMERQVGTGGALGGALGDGLPHLGR